MPFDDLRYLFGEIMYGGHITDDWDRHLCHTYLEEYIKPEMMEEQLYLAPGFPLPGNMDYNSYHQVRNYDCILKRGKVWKLFIVFFYFHAIIRDHYKISTLGLDYCSALLS